MRNIRLLGTAMLALFAATGVHATAEESLFDSAPLDDSELAQARGGLALPNGMTLDFGVIVSTVVDGTRVLQTELRVLGDTITTSVLQAIGTQPGSVMAGKAGNNDGGSGALTVPIVDSTTGAALADGQSAGISDGTASANIGGIVAEVAGSGAKVDAGGVVAGASGASAGTSGLSVSQDGGLQLNMGSITVSADVGGTPQVSIAQSGAGSANGGTAARAAADAGYILTNGMLVPGGSSTVSAKAILPQLMIEHEVGRSITTMVINSGDGRIIDNRLTIDISVGNVQPYNLGAIGYRIQSLGLDAATLRGSGG